MFYVGVAKTPVTLHGIATALAQRSKFIPSEVRSPEKSFYFRENGILYGVVTALSRRPRGDKGVVMELPLCMLKKTPSLGVLSRSVRSHGAPSAFYNFNNAVGSP